MIPDRAVYTEIGRAPLRLSFVGGGTDFAEYYREFSGLVLSGALTKYVTVYRDAGSARTVIADTGVAADGPSDVPPERAAGLLRASQHILGTSSGIRVVVDVPLGSGLGSSSAALVALLRAADRGESAQRCPRDLATTAYAIEREVLGSDVGHQDHYASAFGGINRFEFSADRVVVTPLVLSAATMAGLRDSCMLFFTGTTRAASPILARHRELILKRDPAFLGALHSLRRLAEDCADALSTGQLAAFGELLDTAWTVKRSLQVGVSTSRIDVAYGRARSVGAHGGKLTGAGNSGFLFLFVPPERKAAVRATLQTYGYRETPVAFASGLGASGCLP